MYQTVRLKQGDNKPIDFHLLTWNRDNSNMEDFDVSSHTVTYELYTDETETPLITNGPCTIDDAERGYVSCILDSATLDPGMYRLAYIAVDETSTWRFPEYGFQGLFITSDGTF